MMITKLNIRKHSIQAAVLLTALFLVTGCGGGSSDSGGGSANGFVPITFTGTYDTVAFEGSITIQLVSSTTANVLFTGIRCLESEFSVPYLTQATEFNISDFIPGQPDNTITGGPASITMLWPMNGGAGTLILDPGSDCVPSQGTTNLTRS